MSKETRTIKLPKRFWEDHVERGLWLDSDEYGRDGYGKDVGRHYEVELTDRDIDELLSDARHYSDYTYWGHPSGIGLQSSARAIVKRLGTL